MTAAFNEPLEALAPDLESDDRERRQAAVWNIARHGEAGDLGAVPLLIGMLDDPDMAVWETALDGLTNRNVRTGYSRSCLLATT